jgi:hypothetical protein
MASEVPKAVEDYRNQISFAEEFVKAIKQVGGEVPSALNIHLRAAKMGIDIAESCEKVRTEIQAVYDRNARDCDLSGGGPDDDGLCAARDLHNFNALAVAKTLSWKDDRAIPRAVWAKWKPQLSQWIFDQLRERTKSAARR